MAREELRSALKVHCAFWDFKKGICSNICGRYGIKSACLSSPVCPIIFVFAFNRFLIPGLCNQNRFIFASPQSQFHHSNSTPCLAFATHQSGKKRRSKLMTRAHDQSLFFSFHFNVLFSSYANKTSCEAGGKRLCFIIYSDQVCAYAGWLVFLYRRIASYPQGNFSIFFCGTTSTVLHTQECFFKHLHTFNNETAIMPKQEDKNKSRKQLFGLESVRGIDARLWYHRVAISRLLNDIKCNSCLVCSRDGSLHYFRIQTRVSFN